MSQRPDPTTRSDAEALLRCGPVFNAVPNVVSNVVSNLLPDVWPARDGSSARPMYGLAATMIFARPSAA